MHVVTNFKEKVVMHVREFLEDAQPQRQIALRLGNLFSHLQLQRHAHNNTYLKLKVNAQH